MNQTKNDIMVKIMDRSFSIKCTSEEVGYLHEAANYLNNKLQESVKAQKIYNNEIINIDRLIITALNISNELLKQKKQNLTYVENTNKNITALEGKIDQILDS
jgi:cell division protein ZapA (FtsZ GTPase activity inhibitor)